MREAVLFESKSGTSLIEKHRFFLRESSNVKNIRNLLAMKKL